MAQVARSPRRGKLLTRAELQSRKRTRTAHGGVSGPWSTDKDGDGNEVKPWVHVQPVGGGEATAANMLTANATHLVTLDYIASLTSQKRWKIGSRILNISLVRDVENRHIVHECECKERTK